MEMTRNENLNLNLLRQRQDGEFMKIDFDKFSSDSENSKTMKNEKKET